MKPFENSKTLFRSTLIAAAMAVGMGATGTTLADTAAGAASEPHSDSVAAAIADTAITAKVKAKYLADDRLKGSDISVTTNNGMVALSGTLATAEAKQVAVDLAKGVEGVKSVDAAGLSSGSGQ